VDKPPFWVWNGALNQLYLSAMHFGPARATAYIEAISRYRLRYLLGYASTLSLLAAAAGELHQNLPLAGVITDSEPLLDYQRQTIENAFHCPVHQTYGQAEIVCVASECSYKRLHLWPEVGWTEILDDADRPVAPGQPGRIVATGLLNEEMPLIRYDTRDLGQLAGQGVVCPCSRTLPVLDRVWGRMDDVIVTKDGRHIVQIDRILEPRLHIREAQIVQKGVGQFVVRVVPAKGWCKRDETRLKESLLALVGQAHVTVELVSTIPRTWAGKFRVIVSEMNPQRDVSPAGQPSFCEE
jgi:phenylacetate-CoA ligase